MSFDKIKGASLKMEARLNPFRAGQCLSTDENGLTLDKISGLNPFRAGQCLSTILTIRIPKQQRLNPFRAGQCLSTVSLKKRAESKCLNPFRAGQCLSTLGETKTVNTTDRSQSLSSRAMSFDTIPNGVSAVAEVSIPFEQGNVFRQ